MLLSTSFIFVGLSVFLSVIGFVPEPATTVRATLTATATPSLYEVEVAEDPTPTQVRIQKAGIVASISTPATTDIAVLDRALLSGAVIYPGSTTLGTKGNILMFGHSSYLPVVKNKAYQTFNELGTLAPGDIIVVESVTHAYLYRVKAVRKAKAEDTPIVFDTPRAMLTMVTCDTFGDKNDRYIVDADFINKAPLTSVVAGK